jgi:hypothetical protein
VLVDGAEPQAMRLMGFAGRRSAHAHLFKHVVRIHGLPLDELAAEEDPEAWSEIVPEPPLERSLRRRRELARARLAAVAGCALGSCRPQTDSACRPCHDRHAVDSVDDAFGELLAAYEDAGRSVFAWALANPSRSGPRWVAFRTDRGDCRVKAVGGRHLRAVARLDRGSTSLWLLTCHRADRARSLGSHWLDLCRERAGHERGGTAITVRLA